MLTYPGCQDPARGSLGFASGPLVNLDQSTLPAQGLRVPSLLPHQCPGLSLMPNAVPWSFTAASAGLFWLPEQEMMSHLETA